jgi:DNA-binding transcriptional regulator YiaG
MQILLFCFRQESPESAKLVSSYYQAQEEAMPKAKLNLRKECAGLVAGQAALTVENLAFIRNAKKLSWRSAGDFATRLGASVLPVPAWFSTVTGWAHIPESFRLTARAITSTQLPAPKRSCAQVSWDILVQTLLTGSPDFSFSSN